MPCLLEFALVNQSALPMQTSRDQQIIQAHAAFICQVVEFARDQDARPRFEQLMQQAEQNGWQALAGALRQVAGGVRDLALLGGLDAEDRAIAEAVLRGLQDPASLPDPTRKPDAALAAPGLAGMIHAAATGNVQALSLIGQMAEQMSRAGGDMARIAGAIRPMINGERDPDLLGKHMDVRGRELLHHILNELAALDGQR
jgi:hypothetical protein